MSLRSNKFKVNKTWVVGRMHEHLMIQQDSADVYFLLDAASSYAFGQFIVQGKVPEIQRVEQVFEAAFKKSGRWPKELLIPKEDPVEGVLRQLAEKFKIQVKVLPEPHLAPILKNLRDRFAQFMTRDRPQ